MDEPIEEYKRLLEEDIQLFGYNALRYSIFAGEWHNRQEYQIRIEKNDDLFEVYATGERASVSGKHQFTHIFDAIEKFLSIMHHQILTNRRRMKQGEPTEYPCPLWDGYSRRSLGRNEMSRKIR